MVRSLSRHFPRFLLAGMLALASLVSARAGGEEGNAMDFVRGFLQKYPRFRAEGMMTSTLVGKPPYRCRIEILFDKKGAVRFSYNTDASKNIVPYDYAYANRRLQETTYNRDRSETLKSVEVGAPNRSVFNFVWDLLNEAEHGAGFNSLVFNGLMGVAREDIRRTTTITLRRRIPAGPVETVRFIFDDDQKLRILEITQGNGDRHRLEIRRFRLEAEEIKPLAKPPESGR